MFFYRKWLLPSWKPKEEGVDLLSHKEEMGAATDSYNEKLSHLKAQLWIPNCNNICFYDGCRLYY